MSSLSLPRVLQQRKTSLELERENFEKSQAVSISKAVNHIENPVKEKHVRSTIIGTFTEKGGKTFWMCILRQPVQENRIVAWKFCHVLHKVLREGHPQVLHHSQPFKNKIEDLGKLWCHLREGYGKLILLYTRLLITKLDFHLRNPRFPGNLQVTKEELESIGENDINNYFQMSVEMFDYMDDILNLQAAIFGSLDMSRSNSMTSSGQCRLAPLIPCIQDSSQLYDYCVKILFKLHASLPPDILIGHRDRFLKQFRELREFYINASKMQYFRTLIQIPLLPDNPPNFLVQSDLRSYVTPVVILPPEEPQMDEAVDGNLVDTSDTNSTGELVDLSHHHNGSISPDLLAERDNLIEHLQSEITRLRMEIQRLNHEHQRELAVLHERITDLETQLATKESELVQEKLMKDDLLQQTEVAAKYQEAEEKCKTVEGKFQKLKDVYTKLREEHIQLIRQKADLLKQLESDHIAAQTSQAAMEQRLEELRTHKMRAEETFQKSSALEVQLSAMKSERDTMKNEYEMLQSTIDKLLSEKSSTEGKIQDLLAQKEALDVRLKEAEIKHNMLLNKKTDTENKLYKLLDACLSEAERMVHRSVEEIDNPALSALTCSPDYFRSFTDPMLKSLDTVNSDFERFHSDLDSSSFEPLVHSVTHMAHSMSCYLVNGKTTSNISPDIEFGDRVADVCKTVGKDTLSLLSSIKDKSKASDVPACVTLVKNRISEVDGLVEKLTIMLKGESMEAVGDLVENELAIMDKAIEEAAARIEEMLRKSREADSGIKLEVNEKILDSCTSLMKAIRLLVQKSRILQEEIVLQGKGTASEKEFYKRNHQWTEGLISAAKAVGMGAKFLLTAADKVVSGQGKFEQLVVASQEIAASTAQLVISSRVKADKNSRNLTELSVASKGVKEATGTVVATAKSCSQMIEERADDLDVSGLSLHQTKRLEMESQVRVLELEASVQQERQKLATLRRQHYQLAGELEGWEITDASSA